MDDRDLLGGERRAVHQGGGVVDLGGVLRAGDDRGDPRLRQHVGNAQVGARACGPGSRPPGPGWR
ncbi:hypothetical protein [Nocardioides convexus]|uniref:hypothetical protein n=1 Tax=Nocardioides convexus TaxID=2712224 RepID=UPI0024183C71|nr:hypothetical protein [Nocardioides convexus]